MATLISTARTPRSAAMCGAAGAMTVPSRISMKKAPATRRANPRRDFSTMTSIEQPTRHFAANGNPVRSRSAGVGYRALDPSSGFTWPGRLPCRSGAAPFDLWVGGSGGDPEIKEIDDGEVHADHARHG